MPGLYGLRLIYAISVLRKVYDDVAAEYKEEQIDLLVPAFAPVRITAISSESGFVSSRKAEISNQPFAADSAE